MIRVFYLIFCTNFLLANYEMIEKVAKKFDREFTIFNVGAGDGEFAFEMAAQYANAKFIMVEDNNPKALVLADKLFERCSESEFENTPMLLNKRISNSNFKDMSACMYFDIVTYLGRKHYNTKKACPTIVSELNHMLNIGWHTFFETEADSDLDQILAEFNPHKIFTLDNGNHLYYFINKKTKLSKYHLLGKKVNRTIQVNFSENTEIIKTETLNSCKKIQRQPGLSLIDFKVLYGAFPTTKILQEEQKKLHLNKKLLLYPHEIIVTNNGLKLESAYMPKGTEPIICKHLFTELLKIHTRYEMIGFLKKHQLEK
ncbi:MAG: hypothetical protein S4CHLAM20_12320 [Chlamydiia bacterium]|nr:hypothetical protein [Chlamydiia bacterium]